MAKSHKRAAAEADASLERAMLHAPGIIGNMHGAGRPVRAVPIHLIRAANSWSSAYLPGYSLATLEKALAVLKGHPEQASTGYSKAKSARQRVEAEINRQRAQKP